jgi:hypothetical protein
MKQLEPAAYWTTEATQICLTLKPIDKTSKPLYTQKTVDDLMDEIDYWRDKFDKAMKLTGEDK